MAESHPQEAFVRIMNQRSLDHWTRLRRMARLQKLSKMAQMRLEWMIYYGTSEKNALKTCRYFGIAPKTFWKWSSRFDDHNLYTLESQSRAPKHRRTRQLTPLQEQRIIALRKRFIRYGKMKLVYKYEQYYGDRISSWKIQKVIEAHKLYYHPAKNYRTQRKRLRAQQKKRITELQLKPQTFFLFRIDTVVRYWEGTKRYILTAIDVTSRMAYARMYTSHSSRAAADFLHKLQFLTEGKIQNIQTDNGSEFHKDFEKACLDLSLPHYWSRVRTPKDNPHNERFNRTLQEEFIQLGNRISDPVVFNKKLTEWLIEYNYHRPHQALGYLTPMYLIQHKGVVTPMYSSSTTS